MKAISVLELLLLLPLPLLLLLFLFLPLLFSSSSSSSPLLSFVPQWSPEFARYSGFRFKALLTSSTVES